MRNFIIRHCPKLWPYYLTIMVMYMAIEFNTIITLLQVPTSVAIPSIDETSFTFDASWVFVIIVGIVMMFQIVKFFFQMGERYVIMAVLTMLAPLAFGVGGSKNTEDVFKGWVRMFASYVQRLFLKAVYDGNECRFFKAFVVRYGYCSYRNCDYSMANSHRCNRACCKENRRYYQPYRHEQCQNGWN